MGREKYSLRGSGPPPGSRALDFAPGGGYVCDVADVDPQTDRLVQLGLRLNRDFLTRYHFLRQLTACPLPGQGAAIVVANHISSLDPCVVQSASPRLIRWMMAREYYETPLLHGLCRRVGAIAVQRSGSDLSAVKAALRVLRDGQVLGLFPEGRIAPDNSLQPFQTGAALLAIKARAPIYPAYVDGTSRRTGMLRAYLMPQQLRVRFGPPLRLPLQETTRENLEAATRDIENAVRRLSALCQGPIGGTGESR